MTKMSCCYTSQCTGTFMTLNTHKLRAISEAQLVKENVVDDALL